MATKKKNESGLPAWAETLRSKYISGQSIIFLLHSNIHDPVFWQDQYYKPVDFIYHALLKEKKEVVVRYNVSTGLAFAEKEMEKKFINQLRARRTVLGKPQFENLPLESFRAMRILEEFISIPGQSSGVILEYSETLVPSVDLTMMGADDRSNLVSLLRWAHSPDLIESDNVIILLAENLSEVHKKVVSNPQVAVIEIPMPNVDERHEYIKYLSAKYSIKNLDKREAEMTAGLSRQHLEKIYKEAAQSQEKITFETVNSRKKQIIENECYGLVEILNPTHSFGVVGGLDYVKKNLNRIAHAIRGGERKRCPMGVMFVGPMGTGKTFVAEAFAAESGLTCIKFKNFRDKWVGSTEANLEKILTIVEAMGNVLVIIDEGDRSIGGGNVNSGDSGTSSRVMARLKEFMSDTSHRGRILFLMMTNRPDKLDIDMKRPGRFDRKIPFFYPKSSEDKLEILQAMFKKNGVSNDIKPDELKKVADNNLKDLSGADIEAIVLLSEEHRRTLDEDAGMKKTGPVTYDDLVWGCGDFIPSRDLDMLQYMELLAVFECSSKEMLPPELQLDQDTLTDLLKDLRLQLGGR